MRILLISMNPFQQSLDAARYFSKLKTLNNICDTRRKYREMCKTVLDTAKKETILFSII